jgi:uncharacterized phage-associated protein
MRFPFNERKAAQAAAYLIKKRGGQVNYMKLIKMLYLADRMALLERGAPITGDRMMAMLKGPVLSAILDLITWGTRRGQQSVWSEYVSPPAAYDVTLAGEFKIEDFDELSAKECRILDAIDARYGRVDKWALVDLTHELPEWRDPRGSSYPIDPADILRAEGRPEEEIQRIATEAEESFMSERFGHLELHIDD